VDWGDGDLTGAPVPVSDEDALVREHDAFFAAVRGEAPFDPDGAVGLRALELAAAVKRAL
jgi:predicted dehydrogenase